jgi:hypothetical protein
MFYGVKIKKNPWDENFHTWAPLNAICLGDTLAKSF